ALVSITEQRDARAGELRDQVGLGVVDDHQIRLQRQDALDVRVEQPAHSGEAADLGWKTVERSDARDAITDAHLEEHLCGRRAEGDDATRRRIRADLPAFAKATARPP